MRTLQTHAPAIFSATVFILMRFRPSFTVHTKTRCMRFRFDLLSRAYSTVDAFLIACEQALLFGQAKRASRERASEGPAPRGFAARSRVPARLASLAQIGELARRLRFR